MLVSTRANNEGSNTILIGDDIEVIKLSPGQVKIGINAPKQTPVARGKLKQDHISRETKTRPPVVTHK